MIRLSLLCHARSSAHAATFAADDPAEPEALAQAALLPDLLGRIDRVFAAPERRTQQTAAALGFEATDLPALRDGDFGSWRGCSLADIEAGDPSGIVAWLTDPGAAPHGGESILDVLARVGGWLDGFREPGHTVAVTHPSVIRAAVVHSFQAPPAAFWRLDVEPLGIADLRGRDDRWTLRSLGRVIR
ncbi:MAG TPA: histidine phosphatase family protein [Aliidongia sp.]|nr:histidine phosphatase family protein [Aliidongia sp.]